MRILYLASGPVPSNAANSVHVAHMAGAFAQHKVDVTVLAPSGSPLRAATGNSVAKRYGAEGSFRLLSGWHPKTPGGSRVYLMILNFLLKMIRPDVVYSRHLLGTCFSAAKGYSTVFEAHKPDWERSSSGNERFQCLIDSRSLLGIVCISGALEKYLIDSFPGVLGKTVVAHDAGPNWPSSGPKDPNSPFIVGYFGSLLPGKGLETILSIAPHCPDVTFLVVGGTQDEIKRISQTVDMPLNVNLRPRQDHASVPGLMAKCDVLVAPYLERVETFGGGADVSAWMSPLKLFEYMSTGRPIICSDLPVLREVLSHKHNALLVPPGDSASWIEAIDLLKTDSRVRNRLAKTALDDFHNSYTWFYRAHLILAWIRTRAL